MSLTKMRKIQHINERNFYVDDVKGNLDPFVQSSARQRKRRAGLGGIASLP